MTRMIPDRRPNKTWDEIHEVLLSLKLPVNEPVIFGWRGYYRDSMGKPGENDRGIYDDAVFVWAPTPGECRAFNFNTDPSRYRKGRGTDEDTKGMARLKPGTWSYKVGIHRNKYEALVQAEHVTVIRDGNPDYEDTGWFGINIHRGGDGTTSSLGCQTVPPEQYSVFMSTVKLYLREWKKLRIKYVLIERRG